MGSSVSPSIDTILSPPLLQFSGDVDETFQLCSHDLKMIIFYRCHAQLIFTRVMAFWQLFNSLVSATPLAVLVDFSETFQLLFP